ncbi:MAG: GNAT family N-acetyltransferase [Zoogloeaceae bacterium]|jgi:CelD/BcsL family acetyltransferase involved in cellulose biosynthesis|nr:GNAT family N-acetyltransferase [Zoogloeaceae bacterium]
MNGTPHFVWYADLATPSFPADAYENLLARLPDATPFNRLAWLRAAANASGAPRLAVLTAWREARMTLCLPLIHCRERKAGLPFWVVRHLGYPLTDRIVLAVEPGQAETLAAALPHIRRKLPHTLLQLDELLATPEGDAGLAVWGQRSFLWKSERGCRTPVHGIDEQDLREPSGPPRYKLRRARRRCDAIGAALRRVRPKVDDIDALVTALSAVEQASWKGAQGVGIFSPGRAAWMREALRQLAAEDRVRAVLLEHEGRCVSYRLGFLENGRLYDYNLAFLPDYASLGSGRLLLDEWIRWGVDDGWRAIDASRVSRERSRHQLHERMSGAIEHRQWRFYPYRPDALALACAHGVWRYLLKPCLRKYIRKQYTPS